MSAQFRLCIGQCPAHLSGPEDRLEWLAGVLPAVEAEGADLLLLPELFATGYNIGDLVRDRAEAAEGPLAHRIGALARQYGIAIHYGYAERDGERVFNSAQCIGPTGKAIGHHRKLVIPPGFETGIFAAGSGCTLFTYRGVRIATLICYDAEFAETVRHVAALGAQLVLVPTALGDQWAWVAQTMIPTRAYENGVFVAYANSAGQENGLSFLGQSFVGAPDGVELARAGPEPGLIYADLEVQRVADAQARLPYLADRSRIALT